MLFLYFESPDRDRNIHLGRYCDNIGQTKVRIAGVDGAQVLHIAHGVLRTHGPGSGYIGFWQRYDL